MALSGRSARTAGGASGGAAFTSAPGKGGYVVATVPVAPADSFAVFAGDAGGPVTTAGLGERPGQPATTAAAAVAASCRAM